MELKKHISNRIDAMIHEFQLRGFYDYSRARFLVCSKPSDMFTNESYYHRNGKVEIVFAGDNYVPDDHVYIFLSEYWKMHIDPETGDWQEVSYPVLYCQYLDHTSRIVSQIPWMIEGFKISEVIKDDT